MHQPNLSFVRASMVLIRKRVDEGHSGSRGKEKINPLSLSGPQQLIMTETLIFR
jgi:hypothetical protein